MSSLSGTDQERSPVPARHQNRPHAWRVHHWRHRFGDRRRALGAGVGRAQVYDEHTLHAHSRDPGKPHHSGGDMHPISAWCDLSCRGKRPTSARMRPPASARHARGLVPAPTQAACTTLPHYLKTRCRRNQAHTREGSTTSSRSGPQGSINHPCTQRHCWWARHLRATIPAFGTPWATGTSLATTTMLKPKSLGENTRK